MLQGIVKGSWRVCEKLPDFNVLVRATKIKVALVSGGGSGHEPAHGDLWRRM